MNSYGKVEAIAGLWNGVSASDTVALSEWDDRRCILIR